MRWLLSIILATSLVCAPVCADEDQAADGARGRAEPQDEGFEYTVAPGDTLSQIAERFEITMEALLSQNEGLDPDRIRVGQRLRIVNGVRRAEHTVLPGESLARIAEHYEVRRDDLLRWNRDLRPGRLLAGRVLVIYTRVPESRSESIGSPNGGRLRYARQLPTQHPAFSVRTPERAWGTDETVRWIIDGFEAVRAAHPDAPRIEVHDVSREDGGPLNGHHSHTSGRDADVAYYRESCAGDHCEFRRIRAESLDVARQWALFSYWLTHDRVEAIFMDHALQRALYEHARSIGVARSDLSRWFQYPRGPEVRYGVIRHHPRHANHFHVRFVCPETDADCR
jgi:LysM repeat protein